MSMYDSEAFWHEFMRRPDAQKALKLEQKLAIKEQAEELSSEYDAESTELKEALIQCSDEVKRLVKPIVKYQMVHRILHNLLKDCRKNGNDFNQELLKPEGTIARQLRTLYKEWQADPDNVKAIQDKWTEICLEAKQDITQQSHIKKEHTWRDMPKEELAERLSKGEIMPRDEWIPGLSKGKRQLDANSLKQHLTLGEQMRRDGRDAFEKEDYEMAFTRFTQGVQLLNWVEGTNENDTRLVQEIYLCHLRNQAQAAIKCEKYHEALKACNTIIQDIDEHDCKARYRRGRAYGLLGMIKYAKDDYLFILKSPYADRDSIKAAKAAINDLKKIVNKYKTDARDIVQKSVSEDLFSGGRETEKSSTAASSEAESVRQGSSEGSRKQCASSCTPEDMALQNLRRRAKGRHSKHWFSAPPRPTDTEEEAARRKDEEEEMELQRHGEDGRRRQTPNGDGNSSPKGPALSAEKTKEMLEDLLEIYTTDEVQRELDECRRLGDFEERRVLLRIRKYLPRLQKPILHRYGLANVENDFDFLDAKRVMEQTVGYWRSRDEEVKQLAKECWDAVFGDISDFDV